eukprot:4534133-Pyramimonas_sp.AAC.1
MLGARRNGPAVRTASSLRFASAPTISATTPSRTWLHLRRGGAPPPRLDSALQSNRKTEPPFGGRPKSKRYRRSPEYPSRSDFGDFQVVVPVALPPALRRPWAVVYVSPAGRQLASLAEALR